MINPLVLMAGANLALTALGFIAYLRRPLPKPVVCRPYPAIFDGRAITEYEFEEPDDLGTGSILIYGVRDFDMPHVGDFIHWGGGRISKVVYEREHFENKAYLVRYVLVEDGGTP